ncbi:uncharacterized protein LOC115413272 [Sphaeramia orbicularis]|uniref:Uncharacterized LOC115413272 n=1 Tax=Sphaeramia orbicularis TaxID=375764 RepID=A0A673C0Y8_9TELE|nr:uncharacterized protein LOC115413272 [Sphaeramia orbicularis]
MSNNGITNMRQMMVVISTVEEWSCLKSLLEESTGDKQDRISFSSEGANQICDIAVEARSISFHYADLKQDMTEEDICKASEACFRSCPEGISTFLLLIQGGNYTKWHKRLIEILKSHFGAEALEYLVVLSLDDGKLVDTLDDALLELINICNGRYCRLRSSAAGDTLLALFEMVDFMLAGNVSATGYTENMLDEAKKTSTEDSAMKMLKEKVREAEEKERMFKQLVLEHEERRAKEMEALRTKHNEERRKEAAEKNKYEAKRESLEEAVMSHRALVQVQMTAADDDDSQRMSVVLLGLSGSGKSSALNLILNRAASRYSADDTGHQAPRPTLACQKKEVFASGKRLTLVDTPELWDEDGVENLDLVKDCLALSLPGPHVFLVVLQVGRFTQGESEMLGQLQKVFGREFTEHAVVLFVRFDCHGFKPQSINDYVSGAHSTLQDLVQKCGSRYYDLNVTKSYNALSFPQVKELLSGINKLTAAHGGRSYSVKRFSTQELQDRRKEIEEGKEGGLEENYLLRDA